MFRAPKWRLKIFANLFHAIIIQMHEDILHHLENLIKEAEKVTFIGIGNEMKGDDGVGLYIVEELMKGAVEGKRPFARTVQGPGSSRNAGGKQLDFLIGGTTPENLTGTIKRLKPSHVIFIDAANFNGVPGEVRLIVPAEADGMGFSTHSFPMSMLCKYISDETGAVCLLIGIMPENLSRDGELSDRIKKSADGLIGTIADIL